MSISSSLHGRVAQGRGAARAERFVSGVFLFVLGVVTCGAYASYSQADPSWNTASGGIVGNLFGPWGAIWADLAVQTTGIGGIAGSIALVTGGVCRAVAFGPRRPWRWVWGLVFVMLACAVFAFWPPLSGWSSASGAGGLVGHWLFSAIQWPFLAIDAPYARSLAALCAALSALAAGACALGIAPTLHALRVFGTCLLIIARGLGNAVCAAAAGGRWAVSGLASLPFLQTLRRRAEEKAYLAEANAIALLPLTGSASSPRTSRRTKRRKKARPAQAEAPIVARNFALPALDLLSLAPRQTDDIDESVLLALAGRLQKVMDDFGVKGRIVEVRPGPVVTLFEFEPAPGVKSARVIGLASDVARSMSAASARIAVVPQRNAIGIELPNAKRQTVYLRSLFASPAFRKSKAVLPMALGETIGGEPVVADLAKMPHLLIAGTTGSGKSVGVNAMILSMMYTLPPELCRFIMIDPKMLELSIYEGVPHLLSPVVIDPHKAVIALKWVVREMESRYEVMSKLGVRNIAGFNVKAQKALLTGEIHTRPRQTGYDKETGEPIWENEPIDMRPMPHIVVVVDEMADLMITVGKDVEALIQRIAQMARAAGIHMIAATQRPSVDVITGTIKANFPTRISYMVTTKIDSRTILGEQGAEQLLGQGDLLHMAPGGRVQRLHGPFVADDEVSSVVAHLKAQGEADYVDGIIDEPSEDSPSVADAVFGTSSGDPEQDLYRQAVEVVVRDKRASTSYVQRRLKIGYNRAASLIERMEDEGVVSPANHAGKREILAAAEDSQ